MNSYFASFIGTFVGATAAFLLNFVETYKRQREYEKNCLIKYLYNLNYILRNIKIFYQNFDALLIDQKDNKLPRKLPYYYLKNIDLPLEYVDYDFDDLELDFTAKKNHVYYENIFQLKTELRGFHDTVSNYNQKHLTIYRDKISNTKWSLVIKIIETAKNTENYLMKYYNTENFIIGEIAQNIQSADENVTETIEQLKHNPSPDAKIFIMSLLATQKGWRISFYSVKEKFHIKNLFTRRKKMTLQAMLFELKQSVNLLYENDKYLIEHSVQEQDLSHRIALYLEIRLRCYDSFVKNNYSVDVEYNKNFDDSKKVYKSCKDCNNSECKIKKNVYKVTEHDASCRPDIIIHERGSNNNILVVEIKKDNNDAKKDFAKLTAFSCTQNIYNYKLGIFINIRKDNAPEYRYFIDGMERAENDIKNVAI